jgi:hypothetical protein
MNGTKRQRETNRPMPMLATLILAVALSPVAFPTLHASISVGSVTLAWDANDEPDVAGYRIYYGQPEGSFDQSVDVGNVTTASIENLMEGRVYSFHATCYNSAGLESAPSNAVEYAVPTTVPDNDPPVAHSLNLSTEQTVPLDFTLTGSDPDSDAITFHIVTDPVHGTLAGIAPNLTYLPFSDFVGSDSFTFAVHDGFLTSDPAIVTIVVNSPEPEPDAQPRIIRTVLEEEGLAISWTSINGATYQVFHKTSLLDVDWIPLTDPIMAVGPETTYLEPTPESVVPIRYYAVAQVEASTQETVAENSAQ